MSEKKQIMAGNNSNKQVFDVAKPGKSAPSATSRPVIVGHGSRLQDPMVNEKNPEERKEEPKKAPIPELRKVIVPLSDDERKVEEKPAEKPTPSAEKPEVKKSEPGKNNTEAAVDALADQVGGKKKDKPSDEEEQRQKELEKLVESKKYFLPIGQITRRRNTRRLAIGVVVLLVVGLIGAYLAVDAGLFESPVALPVDLIKN